MMRKGFRFLVCPNCGHRSVYHKMASDDFWECRTRECDYYAYAYGNDSIDVINRKRLLAANPGADIWVGDCYCDTKIGEPTTCPEHSTIEQITAYYRELGYTVS